MKKKTATDQPAKTKPVAAPKGKAAPAPRAPAAKKSATGMTKRGQPKKQDHADVKGAEPVVPDKDTRPEHVKLGESLGLNLQQIEFVEVYLTCYNGARSYMAVYGTKSYNAAAVEAHKALNRPTVRAYLGERMKQIFENVPEAQAALIRTYYFLGYGDVNELVEHRREACRYCHGVEHRYQFTPAELEKARARAAREFRSDKENAGKPMPEFDELGGVGFDPRLDPHPDCPECHGEGVAKIHFNDTRSLSPAGQAMYEGAKVTKDGIEVKTADRKDAREKLAKILKLYEDSTKVVVDLSVDALDKTYGEAMRKAREKADLVRRERGLPED